MRPVAIEGDPLIGRYARHDFKTLKSLCVVRTHTRSTFTRVREKERKIDHLVFDFQGVVALRALRGVIDPKATSESAGEVTQADDVAVCDNAVGSDLDSSGTKGERSKRCLGPRLESSTWRPAL